MPLDCYLEPFINYGERGLQMGKSRVRILLCPHSKQGKKGLSDVFGCIYKCIYIFIQEGQINLAYNRLLQLVIN